MSVWLKYVKLTKSKRGQLKTVTVKLSMTNASELSRLWITLERLEELYLILQVGTDNNNIVFASLKEGKEKLNPSSSMA